MFEDNTKEIVVWPDADPQSVLFVFKRQPTYNVEAQQQVHAIAIGKKNVIKEGQWQERVQKEFQRPKFSSSSFQNQSPQLRPPLQQKMIFKHKLQLNLILQ